MPTSPATPLPSLTTGGRTYRTGDRPEGRRILSIEQDRGFTEVRFADAHGEQRMSALMFDRLIGECQWLRATMGNRTPDEWLARRAG